MDISFVDALENKKELNIIFKEYFEYLVSLNPRFSLYLEQQHASKELEDPGMKYEDGGRMYIVLVDGEVAGCVGFRRLSESACELKRMYLRPSFRGRHISNAMLEKCINDAEILSYEEMYLDTLSSLKSAIALYMSHGFSQIPPYNENPVQDDMLYFRKKLKEM